MRVPQGVYIIGVDIPEGTYEIKADPNTDYTWVTYGNVLKPGGKGVAFKDDWASEYITNPNTRYGDIIDRHYWILTLEKGYYIEVDSGAAIFLASNGKVDLGF